MAKGKYVSGSTVRSVVRAAVLVLACIAALCYIIVRFRQKREATEALTDLAGKTAVYFLDVGQGDACLVRSPHGHFMLIDAGPTDHDASTVHFLRSHGVETLAVMVLTHPHEDHFGGMTRVIHSFDVSRFVSHRDFAETYPINRFRTMLADKGSTFVGTAAGDTFSFDGILVDVLSPADADQNDYNESSLCLRLTFGDTSFLITGDIGFKTENALLAADSSLRADVLKVGHHGSSASSGVSFLDAVRPSAAVISVGAGNDYGHPAGATLKALSERGIDVLRTDRCGSVMFLTDGVHVYRMAKDEVSVERVYEPPVSAAA